MVLEAGLHSQTVTTMRVVASGGRISHLPEMTVTALAGPSAPALAVQAHLDPEEEDLVFVPRWPA